MGAFTWHHTESMVTCDVCEEEISSVVKTKDHRCPASSIIECGRRGHPKSRTSDQCYCGLVLYD